MTLGTDAGARLIAQASGLHLGIEPAVQGIGGRIRSQPFSAQMLSVSSSKKTMAILGRPDNRGRGALMGLAG